MLIAFSSDVFAQQEAMYSQYMFNTMAINPAYAGSRKVTSVTALMRTQWIEIEGAPKTETITVDAPVKGDKVGLGFQLFNDKIGVANTTGGFISYAYRLKMNDDDAFLSFGLQAGVSQFKANYTDVVLTNQAQPTDPAFAEDAKMLYGHFGAGIYYNTDKFYLGLSAPQFFNHELSNTGNSYDHQPHAFLASGYVFPLSESFNLKPSFLIKAVKGAPVEADLNGTLWIKDAVAIGAQYRTGASVGALVQIRLSQQFNFGYAYDYSTTALNNYNSGSHEFMLRFEFGGSNKAIATPRYF